MTTLEDQGIPGVLIASSEFAEAASHQARALGFTPACVFVPHPIQDRTDEEIRALADAAVAEILESLTTTRV
jgi:hypothetical protein